MFQFVRQWWKNQDQATRELPNYLQEAVANFSRIGTRHAAALAYYAIFSVFPMSLLLAVAISKLLGPAAAQRQVASALAIFLPGDTSTLLQENVTQALEQGGSFTLRRLDQEKAAAANRAYSDRLDRALTTDQRSKWKSGGWDHSFGKLPGGGGGAVMTIEADSVWHGAVEEEGPR